MTKKEIANLASRMDEETRLLIDKEVEERLEILKEGDLTEEELAEMEEYLYASFVLQEFLNGEYELLEEERQELFDEMEEMYNKYSDLLVRARIEEKVGKKKRMTLQLMKIREDLMNRKQDYKDLKNQMKGNREEFKKLNDLTKKSSLKDLAKRNKAERGGGLLEGLPAKQVVDKQTALERKVNNQEQKIRELAGKVDNGQHSGIGLLGPDKEGGPSKDSDSSTTSHLDVYKDRVAETIERTEPRAVTETPKPTSGIKKHSTIYTA